LFRRSNHFPEIFIRSLIPPTVLLVSGWVYFSTLYPGIGGRVNYGDSVKFQFLTLVDGLPHSPGFPLYLILSRAASKLFLFLPHPERIAFLSLICGLLTILISHFIVRNLTSNLAVSLAAPLILAFSATFWTQSTEAEVYTLNTMFVAAVCYLFIRYEKSRNIYFLYLGVFLYALSFGNHLSVVGLLPALVYLVYKTDRSIFFSRGLLLVALISVVLGFSQYLYILKMTAKPMAYFEFIGQDPSLKEFFLYITAGQFHGKAVQNAGIALIFKGVARFLLQLYLDFGILVPTLGFVSIIFCFRSHNDPAQKRIIRFLLLAFAGMTLVTIFYDIHDYQVYFLPSFVIFTYLLVNIISIISDRNIKVGVITVIITAPILLYINNVSEIKVKENPIQKELIWVFDNLPDQTSFLFSKSGPFFYDGYLGAYYFKFINEINGKDIMLCEDIKQVGSDPFYLTARDLNLAGDFLGDGSHRVTLYKNSWTSLADLLQEMKEGQLAIIVSTGPASKIPAENKLLFGKLDAARLNGKNGYLGLYTNDTIILEERNLKKPFTIKIERGSQVEGFRFRRNFSAKRLITSVANELEITVNGRRLKLDQKGFNVIVLNAEMELMNSYLFSSFYPGMGYPNTMPPIYKVENPGSEGGSP